jgi:hypothetical protein
MAPPADDPGTTFHTILLPSPAPHLLTEHGDERFLGDFSSDLFRCFPRDFAQLLRELPR